MFSDAFTKRELKGLFLHCTNEGCPWHDSYEAVEVSCGGRKERGGTNVKIICRSKVGNKRASFQSMAVHAAFM